MSYWTKMSWEVYYKGSYPPSLRKALAANYTSLFSSKLLAKLAVENGNITVIDPFCGSGWLLTAVLDQTTSQPDFTIQVIGNELLGITIILALARLLYWFKSHHRVPNLHLTSGDAFERTPPLLSFQIKVIPDNQNDGEEKALNPIPLLAELGDQIEQSHLIIVQHLLQKN